MKQIAFKDPVYNTELERRAFKYLTACRNLSPQTAAREIEEAHRRAKWRKSVPADSGWRFQWWRRHVENFKFVERPKRTPAPEITLLPRRPRRPTVVAIADKRWDLLIAKVAPLRVPAAFTPVWRAAA